MRARWCERFLCRLRGLTFRRALGEGEGLLLVDARETRAGSAIHMWGVWIALGVAWLDAQSRVVDRRLAQPWRLYLPAAPARFVLEGHPSMLDRLELGDCLEFEDEKETRG